MCQTLHNTKDDEHLDHTWRIKDRDKDPGDAEIPDPSALTDDDLKAALLKHGFKAGPIVASTRALYEKKLRTLLRSNGHDQRNGTEKGVLYSDSEEDEEENVEEQDRDSDSEGEDKGTVEQSEQIKQESNQLSQEPVKNTFKDIFPDAVTTPTGIYATCRRPIKGAAERPIQFAYPESPLSPTTLERQELERRLVPIRIQLMVFFIVACLLYLFYAFAEDNALSPVMALLDSLNQESESAEGFLLQAETQDTAPLSGQE